MQHKLRKIYIATWKGKFLIAQRNYEGFYSSSCNVTTRDFIICQDRKFRIFLFSPTILCDYPLMYETNINIQVGFTSKTDN